MGLFDGTPLERPVTCDACGRVVAECACPPAVSKPATRAPSEQSLRVRRERRRGKWCAVVAGLDDDPAAQKALLSALRTKLGCGGGLSDADVVLQGDCRDALIAKLTELGYKAKASGG